MKKIIVLLLLLIPYLISAQVNPNSGAPDVFPVNPQASNLLSYREGQISTYTGTDNITVPIYTLETKAIDIPISLIYQTGGVKVMQESGWVGLGWKLSTDMEIIQTVVGLDDFGYYGNRSLPNYECLIPIQSSGLTASSVMSQQKVFFLGFDDNWNAENSSCYYDPAYYAGIKDSEPDIFHFNALGYSGKFLLDWESGEFKSLTDKNVLVEAPNFNGSPGITPYMFILHFPDGNKFKFELKEETLVNMNVTENKSTGATIGSNIDFVNRNEKTNRVYKLTEIHSNKADLIEFQYVNTIPSGNFPLINESYRTYEAYSGSNFFPQNAGKLMSFLATEQEYSYLSTIKYNDVRIEFKTSSRIDLKEAKKLDQIVVKYKGIVKDDFTFDYSYFVGNESGNDWSSLLNFSETFVVNKTSDEISHRLKLDAFHGKETNAYKFIYEDVSLPVKTSYSTDYWGYYNGQGDNVSYMPNIYRFNIQMCNDSYSEFEQNNRSPDLNYAKAGSLKKVIFPTGGGTEYNYELNSFSNYPVPSKESGGEKKILEISTGNGDPNALNQVAEVMENDCTIMEGSALLSTRGCNFSQLYDDTYIKIERFSETLIPTIKNAQYGYLYGLAMVGVFRDPVIYDTYIEDVQYIQMRYDDPEEKVINDLKLELEKGVYVFTAYGGCGTYNGTENSSQASLSVHYRMYDQLPESTLSYGAGLRISEIKKYNSINSSPELTKKFEYRGGKLMTPLIFFNQTQVNYEQHRVYSISCSGNDPGSALSEVIGLNQNLTVAWQRFLSNPSEGSASQIDAIIQEMNNIQVPYNCQKIIRREYFNGLRDELFSGSLIQPSLNGTGKYVGYDKVIERSINSNTDNGRVEYNFLNSQDEGAPQTNQGDGYFSEVNVPFVKNYPENGLLDSVEFFDSAGNKLRSVKNRYKKDISACYWGSKTLATDVDSEATSIQGITFRTNYLTAVYPIKTGESLLSETEIVNYSEEGAITSRKEFIHDPYNQVKIIKEYNSKGELREIRNKYAYDSPVHHGMVNRNYISPIMESEVLINGESTYMEKKVFTYWNTENYLGAYLPSEIQQGRDGSNLTKWMTFHRYDKDANLSEFSKLTGPQVVIIWGYDYLYPVAVIENASYSEVATALGISVSALEDFDQTDLASINALRNNSTLSTAQITTYTYDPLVGIQTIQDPNNYTIYYEYDDNNRLKYVRDFEGNILSENEYHFKNQQ